MAARRRMRPTGPLALVVALATLAGMSEEIRSPELDASSVQSYCSLFLDLETFSRPSSGYEALSNEDQYRIAGQMAESARPLVEAVHELAPLTITDDTQALLEGVEEVAQTGDFRILGLRGGQAEEEDTKLGPQAARVREALERLHAYNLANCSWQEQEVVAVDNAFPDFPATIPAGLVSFEFRNDGSAPHTLGIERLEREASLDELLQQVSDQLEARPEDAEPGEVTFAPGATTYLGEAFAPTGKDDYLVLDLEPGDYVAVCFVPQGSTYVSEENETIGTGPPHALSGMVNTFTVE